MALEKRQSKHFSSRISAIFTSHDHPNVVNGDESVCLISLGLSTDIRTSVPALSRSPLVNPGNGHITLDPRSRNTLQSSKSAPSTPVRSTKDELPHEVLARRDESPMAEQTLTTPRGLHRETPFTVELLDLESASLFNQLEQESRLRQSPTMSDALRRPQEGLTYIMGTLEKDIGSKMGSSDDSDSYHRLESLRLASAEPLDSLSIYRSQGTTGITEVTPRRATYNQNTPLLLPCKLSDIESESGKRYSSKESFARGRKQSPILKSPSKDIKESPLLPVYGIGHRRMLNNRDSIHSSHSVSGTGNTIPEVSSPLKSLTTSYPSKLPLSDGFDFSNSEGNNFGLGEESESVGSSQDALQHHLAGSAIDFFSSATTSHNSFVAQTLSDVLRGVLPVLPVRNLDTSRSAISDSLSDLPAFFSIDKDTSTGSLGSKTNLDGIRESAHNSSEAEFSLSNGPGYPVSDPAIEWLQNYTFGTLSIPMQPRTPLKQTPTFASTDSGVSRTWPTSALLQNFHARVLLTSSITSSNSGRHVNLATLKRAFSLRPGEGERSTYVQTIRRNAGTSYNDVGPGKWKLPTGILPIDKKSLYLQSSNKYNRGAGGGRSKKTSGVELKHGHLQPRLLAAEVDDTDDSNKFGSLGRSSTTNTKVISPVTSKSSTVSILGAVSRQSSLHRTNTLASASTNNDTQSFGTRDSSSKLPPTESEVSSLGSDGSISEYKFGDGYYQHPGYKYGDDEDFDTDNISPPTDESTSNHDYEDDIDEDKDKPRLFLANPDESSDEN